MTRGLEDKSPKDLVEWEVNLGLRYALDIGWPSRHAEAFDAVFAVPFHRLPPREDLPGEPERMGGKVDALVEGVDLSARSATGRSSVRPGCRPREPVGMGLIGSGYMGRTYAACLTRHVPDGRLVSVWGGKRAPALAEEFGVEADDSLATLLARPEVEAVVITSPHTAHRPQAEAAAAAGKHVYIEKPMSVSVADCDAIIAACDGAGVKLTVNFVTRFRHAPKAMKRLVDEGGSATPDRRDARDVDRVPARGHRRRGDRPGDHPEEGMGVGPGRGLAVPRLGRPRDRRAALADRLRGRPRLAEYHTFGTPPPVDLTAQVQLTMQNGVMAQMLMTYETPEPGLEPNDWTRIVGSKGIIEADHYGEVRLGDADGWRVADKQVAFDFLGDYLDPNRLEGFAAQVQDFAEAIPDGRDRSSPGRTAGRRSRSWRRPTVPRRATRS